MFDVDYYDLKTGYFRRPEADENRPNADEKSRFRRPPDEIGRRNKLDKNRIIFVGNR
jgi:hypothetical protein